MRRTGLARAGCMVVALAAAASPSAAEAEAPARVIEGSAAQALRCATYIVMAGQYGYAAGQLTASDRATMARWSADVLGTHLALAPYERLVAYGAAMGELGSEPETRALIARHGEWCLRAFTLGTF